MKPTTPTWAIDALIGDKEYKKNKREQRKKLEGGPQPNYPEVFGCILRPVWITRSTYCETPDPQGVYIYIFYLFIIYECISCLGYGKRLDNYTLITFFFFFFLYSYLFIY